MPPRPASGITHRQHQTRRTKIKYLQTLVTRNELHKLFHFLRGFTFTGSRGWHDARGMF